MSTPSTENYMLGRGSLYWAPYDPVHNTYGGERHMGNATEVQVSMGVDRLEHYSSMSGMKSKDKVAVSQVAPTITFTLEEFDSDNWKLLVYGTSSEVTQAAHVSNAGVVIASPEKSRYYDLGFRSIQSTRMTHGTVTGGPFQVGETVTGGTSSATAVVLQVLSGGLILSAVTGTFQAAETITGGTSNATAAVSTIPAVVSGLVSVKSTSGSTYYTAGTDYTIDAVSGRMFIPAGSTIPSASITVTFGNAAETYTQINGLTSLEQEGRITYISDNPQGGNYKLTAWRTSVTPQNETALIGDGWGTMQFQAEVLRDAVNHPSSPYMDLQVY